MRKFDSFMLGVFGFLVAAAVAGVLYAVGCELYADGYDNGYNAGLRCGRLEKDCR